MAELLLQQQVKCFHCGDDCTHTPIIENDKSFCCEGCKTVYLLLEESDLCAYYDLEKNPGIKVKARAQERFAYLDEPSIVSKLLDFEEGNNARIRLYIPQIHCSSCIWLLENLYKLREGISYSHVNFTRKEITISYTKDTVSLRTIVELLDSFGYTPSIHLENYTRKKTAKEDLTLYYKIGIAGFCSGNIMLLSFPEYFGMDGSTDPWLKVLFGYLNLFLSLPVIFFSARDYFTSAYAGLKNKVLNLDVPIALGTTAVFLRSIYEVVMQVGPGYFDSLTGLIFFLLIGKWVQNRTYQQFSFERDYRSYFPAAVTRIEEEKEKPVPVNELKKGDEILVRNHELIPADAVLVEGKGYIDYSFVSGEAAPVAKEKGEVVFAGGRQTGNSIRLKVTKDFSNSYLLQLWEREVFAKKKDAYLSSFVLSFSKYFIFGTFLIAGLTFLYWYVEDPSKMLFAFTSVLLVACPCALALSLPFALNNCLRWMGRKGLYLKSSDTVELLAEVDALVFDKTGTLTEPQEAEILYSGEDLTSSQLLYIRSAVRQSSHPLSRALYNYLKSETVVPDHYEEIPSEGIYCKIGNNELKIGSVDFVGGEKTTSLNESRVYVKLDCAVKGFFSIRNKYRKEVNSLLEDLGKKYELHLLSGDNDSEKEKLRLYFGNNMKFNQLPEDKLNYIEALQQQGKKVLMLGDGLNDAGALKAADVGISVSDNVYSFFPSCDGILEGKKLGGLSWFLRYAQSGVMVIKMSLVLSLLYNIAGLFFAVQGFLSPLIAAILMPLSSVTVVLFVVFATSIGAKITKSFPGVDSRH